MQYYSTNGKAKEVSFKEAVFNGLPEDNGLYMPRKIEKLPKSFFHSLSEYNLADIAFQMSYPFIDGEIDDRSLRRIVDDAFNFEAPVYDISDGIHVLELFHGPTLAFKDFGARFMARTMGHFLKNEDKQINILVATSGDTGSAVAQGFFGVDGIKVTLLYPKGKVSKIQEQQLTTIGGNVQALEVEGTFDDCQNLVKTAFLDQELRSKLNLSSANSINIARLLPQSFYYVYAYKQIASYPEEVYFCTPSGNFGNLCAGVLAWKMGLPVKRFVAATNINDVVPEYLLSGVFSPRPSKQTISNAMDVGNPSNFPRILDIYGSYDAMAGHIKGTSYTDAETRMAIKQVYDEYRYVLCPHSAIGYQGLSDIMDEEDFYGKGIFLSTASPVKFGDVVEPIIHEKIDVPERLQKIISKKKNSIPMTSNYDDFKSYLMRS